MVNAWCHISIFQVLQSSADVLSDHILSRPRHHPLQPTSPVQKFSSVSLLCSSWLDVPIIKLSVHHCCNLKYVHIVYLFVKYTMNKFWRDVFSSSINSPFCKHMFLIIHKLCMKESREHPKGEFWRILLISFLPLSFPRDKLVHIASSFRAYLLLSMSVFLSVLPLLCLSGRGWAMSQVNVSTEGSHILGRKITIAACACPRVQSVTCGSQFSTIWVWEVRLKSWGLVACTSACWVIWLVQNLWKI